MTRRSLPTVFLLLLVSMVPMSETAVQANGAETFHLSKTFTDTNPCTGEVVTGELNAVFVIQAVWIGENRLHVTLHASAHGVVTGRDNAYLASFEGTEQFDLDPFALPPYIDVPLHAEAISLGSAPNFTADGVARVLTAGSDVDVTFTPSCG